MPDPKNSRDKHNIELQIKQMLAEKADKEELAKTGRIRNPRSLYHQKVAKDLKKKQTFISQDNRTKEIQEIDENKGKFEQSKKEALKRADVVTDVMQLGNFVPHPAFQTIGKAGNVLGSAIDGYQSYNDFSNGNYGSGSLNLASAMLPMFLGKSGYRRDMYNTNPSSLADNIASLGSRNGNYIPLTTLPHAITSSTIKGINYNKALLGTLGAETTYDTQYALGGQLNNNMQNNNNMPDPKKKPIIVNSKNDPRYRAYQDSLEVYKRNEQSYIDALKNAKKTVNNTTNWKYSTKKVPYNSNPDYNNPNDLGFKPIEKDKIKIYPTIGKDYGLNHRPEDPKDAGKGKNETRSYGGIYERFKKPQQPVIIKQSQQQKNYVAPIIKKSGTITGKQVKEEGNKGMVFNQTFEPKDTPQVTPLQKVQTKGLIESNQKLTAPLPIFTPQAQIPKSFDINYSTQRMNGGKGYYDQNNQVGVDLETALRAKEQADRINAGIQKKYGNSTHPNAIERLNTIKDTTTITPQYAYGGQLNNNMQNNNLTRFDEGGLHHQNPLGGVPIGGNNTVEEGETKMKNYVYSNRLSIDENMTKEMNLPSYIKGKTFASASKAIDNKFKDRNDKHSLETKNVFLDRLKQAQETLKQQEQQKAEQIAQSMQSNQQEIPDMMNGEIPEGMEEFAEGGYYDGNSPFFSQDVMNPGANPMGPYNQTPISLPSPAGLSKLSNPGLSAPTDMGISAGQTPVKGGGFATMGNVMGGLGIVNSLAQGDTAGALMGGAQTAAANGLFGAGASGAMGSMAPAMAGIGAVQGAIGLNELAKGNGASRNKIGSAATGAMTGAMAGAGFGPAGIIAGGAIGAIAGGIGSGNRREQDAELGSLNAKNANNVFRDKRYAALGGPLELSGPIEGTFTNDELTKSLAYMYKNPGSKIPLNAQFRNDDNLFPNNSTENIQSTIGTYPDGIIGLNTKKGLTDWSFRNSETFRNLPANKQNWNELPNGPRNTLDLTEKGFTKMGLTPGGRQFLEPVSNLTPTGVTYNKLQNNVSVNDINKIPLTNSEIPEKEPSFLSKLGNSINNNTVGNALRLAPVAMNAYQLAKLKKPGIQSLSRLSNTYKPQYLDEATLQNAVGNENRNTINALTNSSGGSEAALRAGILGAGLNATRGRSDAYMKMRDYNNQQNIAGQQFQLGVDQANMSQSNLEMDINDRNQGNYDTQKSKLIGQIGTDLGSIGKEKLFADKAGKMFGYDENGKYILTPEGKKSYISDSEESTSLTDEQKAYLKTMPKAFGGYLRTNKKGY